MFFSQGIDIIEVCRIKKIYRRFGDLFLKKILTDNEIKNLNGKRLVYRIANRFAAKEAIVKALGTGFRKDISFKDIEISNDVLGKPEVIFLNNAKIQIKKNRKNIDQNDVFISISDEKKYVVAVATIFSDK